MPVEDGPNPLSDIDLRHEKQLLEWSVIRTSSEVDSGLKISKLLVWSAALIFFLPLLAFAYMAYFARLEPTFLWLSVILSYYMIRFIDFETIGMPSRKRTIIPSIIFLATTLFLVIQPFLVVSVVKDVVETLSVYLFFMAFGFTLIGIHTERQDPLLSNHPAMFYETRIGGLFNICTAYYLATSTAMGDAFQTHDLFPRIAFLYGSVVMYVSGIPFYRALAKVVREQRGLRKTKDGRKLAWKIAEDRWDTKVASRSKVGAYVSRVLIPLSIISMYTGILGVNLWMATGTLAFLISGIYAISWAITIFSYRLRRSGLAVKAVFQLMLGTRQHVPNVEELRRLSQSLLSIYMPTLGALLTISRLMPPNEFVANVSGVRITQLVFLYADFFVILMMTMVVAFVRFLGLTEPNVGPRRRAAIDRILKITFRVYYVLTGGITGTVAHAFGIPLLVDAMLVAAWIMTVMITQYYLVYLRGGERITEQWKLAKTTYLKRRNFN